MKKGAGPDICLGRIFAVMNGLKRVSKYLGAYRKEAVSAPLFKLLEALMDLITPIIIANIINNGIGKNNFHLVVSDFFILVLLAVLGMAFSFTAQYFSAKSSVGTVTLLRQALFDHVENLSYTELDKMGTDSLITRMTSDMNQVQNGLNLALRLLLRSPFIVFGSVIMVFTIDLKCAIIFLITVPVLSIVIFSIMAASIPLYKKSQSLLDGLLKTTRENLTGVRVVRAFNKEWDEIDEFEDENDSLTRMNEFVGKLSALMNPLTFAIINIATIILIYEGGLRVNTGRLSTGALVALYNYMAQIIVELIKLANLIININRSLASAERIDSVFRIESSMYYPKAGREGRDTRGREDRPAAEGNGSPASDHEAVRFDHVSFRYAMSDADALTDIDFSVKKGETVGIIGGTGSGKTSLINLIPRFYDVTKGEILVDGVNVKDYEKGRLIEKIGMVPQKAALFEGTIRDNLRIGRKDASDEDIMKAISTAQAVNVIEAKEKGLDEMIEQGGRNLSGGQRQRLTIARALVRDPEILILDDSTSALDFATDLRLRQAVSKLGITVFIVSERASSVMSADKILVLDDGKMAGLGSHEELLKNSPVYREIYYSQFPEENQREA